MKLAALCTALLCSSAAHGWQAYRGGDGQYRRWTSWPLKLKLQPAGAGVTLPAGFELAARRALQGWQAVETAGASVRYAGPASASAQPAPGEVLLSFDGAEFPASREVVGITELMLDSQSGHLIVAAHVHLNGRDFKWATDGSPNALDVQSIAAHELGHALGLAHPCGDPGTATPSCDALPVAEQVQLKNDLMWPWATPGPRRALTDDDAQGLATLVPVSAPEPAPQLDHASPACAPKPAGLALTLYASRAEGADRLIVAAAGTTLADVPAQRNASGVLAAQLPADFSAPAGATALDLLLVVSQSGKAAELVSGLALSGCSAGGCGTSSAQPLWALLALPLGFLLRRRRSLPAALGAGALLFTALPAHAWVRSLADHGAGPCLFWSTRGHSFQIDAQGTPDVPGSSAFDAVRKSFAAWAAISCSDLSFPDLGLSTDPNDRRIGYVSGAFNRNLIMWRTSNCSMGGAPPTDPCLSTPGSCGNKYDCWDHGDNVLAVTTTTYNRTTGQIYDADIELNDAPQAGGGKFQFTTVDSGPVCSAPGQTNCIGIDVQNTLTHETGHSIGLDHSLDGTATMFAFAPPGDVGKRNPHPDDVQAVCTIYPLGKPTVTCVGDPITLVAGASSDGGGCGCSQHGSGSPLGAILALSGLLILRRRRLKR